MEALTLTGLVHKATRILLEQARDTITPQEKEPQYSKQY